jgi:hypothetical protein
MNSAAPVHPHEKLLIVASVLTLIGLGLGIVHVLWSTPYTMVAFMGPGQIAIMGGGALFLFIVLADVRARLQSVVEKRFSRGQIVFRQGDFPDRLYLIGKGEAEVLMEKVGGEEATLARLNAGDFFGEMGIMGNYLRSATVVASTDLETLSIHRSYLDPIFSYLPSWKEKVAREFVERTAENEGLEAVDRGKKRGG